ncbi:hypothetical protein Val02_82400 [Virgisporangium aliadipatigenens]|uniref:Uncharacterized protein n=1 Tax=Virgisporangium aliadipatigenens TaxID=741659 RepID=A0A8J4DV13_9ACTN|nr:hypothetical protein [Virgisporangium aliadipatigenens]GIJ51354.1 hypothetical protein Val02_82400 [Virgisporangium aliadipatigenens]
MEWIVHTFYLNLGSKATGGVKLADLPGRVQGRKAVLDGELVALDAGGRPSFTLLQDRMLLRTIMILGAACLG